MGKERTRFILGFFAIALAACLLPIAMAEVLSDAGSKPALEMDQRDDKQEGEVASPEIMLMKTANESGFANVGAELTYTFAITNTGNVTLYNITLTDAVSGVVVSGNPIASLGAGASDTTTFTARYIVTQADIDAGSFTNTATVSAEDPNADPVSDAADETVSAVQNPELTVSNTASPATYTAVGDDIYYTIGVFNAGNVTVTDITVTDSLTGLNDNIASLAPGASQTYMESYRITQVDLDAGSVVNTASATGQDPNAAPVSDAADETVTRLIGPSAVDDAFLDNFPGEPVLLDVLLNDIPGDAALDPATVQIVGTSNPGDALTVPGEGVWSVNPTTGAITFTPELGFTGDPTSITYTVRDTNNIESNVATVTVTYLTGPSAVDDASLDNLPGAPALLDVLLNDIPGDAALDPATVQIVGTSNPGDALTVPGEGVWSVNPTTGAITFTPESGFTGDPTPIAYTVEDGNGLTSNEATVTVTYSECLTIEVVETWVYLEGAQVNTASSTEYTETMRTDLNDSRLLPGQTYDDRFLGVVYQDAGQPYGDAPWFYSGTEGDLFDSEGDPETGDAGYPATVVDWVLVTLRETPDGADGPVCEAAALLHNDGRIEFVGVPVCCSIDVAQAYYVVVEHHNHLIVMSHEPVAISGGRIEYDFRMQQSYVDDPFEFGATGQKETLPGVFAMLGGNGAQWSNATDINVSDRTFWENDNSKFGQYSGGDYNLDGDADFSDRILWGRNNGEYTSVPRD